MNRHSLFFRLNLLFLIATGVLVWLTVVAWRQAEAERREDLQKRVLYYEATVRHALLENGNDINRTLQEKGLTLLDSLADELPVPKRMLQHPPAFYPLMLVQRLKDGRLQVYENGRKLYLIFRGPHRQRIVAADLPPLPGPTRVLLYAGVVFTLFLLLFLSVRRALLPLRELSRKIERFGDGDLDISTRSDKKDEIALIANRFDEAIGKIRAMREARTLFMRNIMHELKTPITRGKLSIELIEKSEEEQVLRRAFERMEQLIAEMAEVERITSRSFTIEKEPCFVSRLIERAEKLLFLSKPTPSKGCDLFIEADCNLLAIVLKNLIDNALKYGEAGSVRIECDAEGIEVINRGEPLRVPFKQLLEPFAKAEGGLTRQSFGLGLYIVQAILQAHGAELTHLYIGGEHRFRIEGMRLFRSPSRSAD